MKILILAFILIYSANGYGDQKYNPYTGTFETTSPDATLEYNGFSDTHEYVSRPIGKAPRLEYNAHENVWEFAPVTDAPRNPLTPPSPPKAPTAPRL